MRWRVPRSWCWGHGPAASLRAPQRSCREACAVSRPRPTGSARRVTPRPAGLHLTPDACCLWHVWRRIATWRVFDVLVSRRRRRPAAEAAQVQPGTFDLVAKGREAAPDQMTGRPPENRPRVEPPPHRVAQALDVDGAPAQVVAPHHV